MMTTRIQVCLLSFSLVALTCCGGSANPTPQPTGPMHNGNGTAAACTTAGAVNANVVIQTSVGPHGESKPVTVSNTLYSQNIYDQNRAEYVPTADATYVAYLGALRPAYLRWPAGYYSQTYTFMPNGPEGQYNLTPSLLAAYMDLCKRSGAKPMITVNINTASAANAAALVTFVNKTMGYNVQWWEIGNEPDVDGIDASHSPQIYAAQYAAFAAAMKQADPSIHLAGAVLLSGEDILGEHDAVDWLTPIMQATGSNMNAVSWHYYPLYSSKSANNMSSSTVSTAHLLQENATDWPPAGLDFDDSVMPHLRKIIAQYSPGAQVWIDEFAEDPGYLNGAGVSDRFVGALWAADALGRYAEYGIDQIYKFIFRANPEHKYTLIDENEVPRPEYYTYWLYAQHFGTEMVKASSDQIAAVASHAALNPTDGSLRVVLVNKRSTPQATRVTLADFTPSSATQYLLQSDSVDSTQATLNQKTLTTSNIGQGADAIAATPAQACKDNIITVPPYSVMLVTFNK